MRAESGLANDWMDERPPLMGPARGRPEAVPIDGGRLPSLLNAILQECRRPPRLRRHAGGPSCRLHESHQGPAPQCLEDPLPGSRPWHM